MTAEICLQLYPDKITNFCLSRQIPEIVEGMDRKIRLSYCFTTGDHPSF